MFLTHLVVSSTRVYLYCFLVPVYISLRKMAMCAVLCENIVLLIYRSLVFYVVLFVHLFFSSQIILHTCTYMLVYIRCVF